MDGVINSLLLFSQLAEDKKNRVAQIPTAPYFWMDGGTVHQPRPSFTSARLMAALVWEKHPVPLTFLHRGGDKWGKEPIGAANGMTAVALLPASEAGGVLRRGQTADAPNQRESLAFNSGRCPLLTPSLQISFFGLAPTAVVQFISGKKTLKGEESSVVCSPQTPFCLLSQRARARIGTPCPLRVSAARLHWMPACCHVRLPAHAKTRRGVCLEAPPGSLVLGRAAVGRPVACRAIPADSGQVRSACEETCSEALLNKTRVHPGKAKVMVSAWKCYCHNDFRESGVLAWFGGLSQIEIQRGPC